jgi:hypothetical protein
MNTKKLLITGLSIAMLSTPFFLNTESVMAKEQDNKITHIANFPNKITKKQIVKLAAQWAKTESYIQSGGNYKEGEYRTFTHKGTTYRYLSNDIDTKKELFNLVNKMLTPAETLKWFKKSNIIVYKGKTAQPEADGGSLLEWEKAKVEYVNTAKKTMFYRLIIPIGDTGTKEMRIVEIQKDKSTLKISKIPYLDIPFNINPAFIFFNYLLIDHNVSQKQLLNVDLKAEEFKKGIVKLEIHELKEVAKNKSQVEYMAKFYVELEKGYKGSLKNGLNQMFCLIQQTDEMEYKIVSIGTTPHITE